MTITYRQTKGSALLYGEVDENFRDLLEDTNLQRVLTNGNTSNLDMTVNVFTSNTANIFAITANTINAFSITVDAFTANSINISSVSTGSANVDNSTVNTFTSNTANIQSATINVATITTANVIDITGNTANVQAITTNTFVGETSTVNTVFTITTAKTPLSAIDTGLQGQIAWDLDYIYVCVANNTWKRASITTWV